MHENFVPQMIKGLEAQSAILTKAEAHCTDQDVDPNAILSARLFPDMFTFTKQVQVTCDFAARAAARLSGTDVPSFPDTETSFEELRQRIDNVVTYIASFKPDQFDESAEMSITLKLPMGEIPMTGHQFLNSFALPNFYFHLTPSYNILRHNGLQIGKRDFMGV
jgi:hypothetical protein